MLVIREGRHAPASRLTNSNKVVMKNDEAVVRGVELYVESDLVGVMGGEIGLEFNAPGISIHVANSCSEMSSSAYLWCSEEYGTIHEPSHSPWMKHFGYIRSE